MCGIAFAKNNPTGGNGDVTPGLSGAASPPGPKRRGPAPQSTLLNLNGAPLRVRELIGTVSDAPLMVSTYGFSTTGAPTILPVRPALMGRERDAA
jgi:hypothetical protein